MDGRVATADEVSQPSPIPVIDLSSADTYDGTDGSPIVDAAAKYGFIFVKGEALGFSQLLLNDIFALV